jgi:hypothetical protein
MATNNVAIRKRTQIAKANQMMFLWVAGSSVVVGVALVVSIALIQVSLFKEKVINTKETTVANLISNNNVIGDLQSAIRVLDTNESLMSVRVDEEDQAIRVILDALPSDANSLALGASIQYKLLANIDGLRLNTLQLTPVYGLESFDSNNAVQDASASTAVSQNFINFRYSVTGSEVALKQALANMERSIRTMEITSLKIEGQGGGSIMSVQARSYYEPAKVISLTKKLVKR